MEFIVSEIPIYKIIEMLSYEEKIKYSDDMQEIYSKQYYESKDVVNKLLNLDVEIQRHVLETFGYLSNENNLKEYWKIPGLYKDNEDIKNSVFYIRYNIFEFNKMKIGKKIPPCRLINTENKEIQLNSLHNNNKPLVLLAGSIT